MDVADALPEGPDIEVDVGEGPVAPPCSFITGVAGTGKTFHVRRLADENPKWGLICATTGVSAVNLGTITLNSALGYFDTASLEDKFVSGYLRTALHRLAAHHRNLVIDEVSMLDARQLDILYDAVGQVNEFADVPEPMGLVAVGDFAQLPPVNAPWAFEAECWSSFDANTTKLTKCWRQGEGPFLDALNRMRVGDGRSAVDLTRGLVSLQPNADPNFDGTTIVATNRQADDYNHLRYRKLQTASRNYPSRRWGREPGGSKLIPEVLALKDRALVMILVNDAPKFTYVNGDLGHVVELGEHGIGVELIRNKSIVRIGYVERLSESRDNPAEFSDDECEDARKNGTKLADGSYWSASRKRWIRGSISYIPLRLGWASTCFKSQGLSLDKVQVDLRHNFMSTPGMVYVACSRARTGEGLRLVGNPDMFVRRCKVEPKIARWL